MRRLLLLLAILTILLLLPYSLKATGFQAASNSLFTDIRAHAVGDILTVRIYEDAQASSITQTTGEKSNKIDSKGGPGVGPLDFIPLFGLSAEAKNSYDGKGGQTRKGNLKAHMTVKVVALRPNGDLIVEGNRVIGINSDKEIITLTGIVRSQDVGPDNTIESYNLADAQITYQGKGAASNAGRPGILARFLNWLF